MNQVLSKPVPIEILRDLMTKLEYCEIFLIPERKKALSDVNNLQKLI